MVWFVFCFCFLGLFFFFEVICPLICITPDMPGISMLKGNSRCLNLVFITFLMFFLRREVEDSEVTEEISLSGIAMKIREDDKPEVDSPSRSMNHSCKLEPKLVLSNVTRFHSKENKVKLLLKIIV